ncbi:hypothetical protein V1498_20415 [Peribacillus sp. SCS-26]|uniref:hypothetical protein n=1 Tax=Paraperibacillus marinus TaxID=3115295 RepID=UPI0039069FEB
MFTVDQYLSSIKANLEKKTDLLVSTLKNVFSYNFPADIDLLDFNAFIEPTRFELSIIMFSVDREANEVIYSGSDKTVFAGSEEVLSNIEYYQLKDSQSDEFSEFYDQHEGSWSHRSTKFLQTGLDNAGKKQGAIP